MPPHLMTDYRPPTDPLLVLHQDADLLIVSKPSGLLSVPGKPEAHSDCLLGRVVAAFPGALLIHRLDMETSGVMVFALTRLAQRHINWQFERREVEKTYVARVQGRLQPASGRVELPLIADWPNRPLQKVCHETGKPAVTAWRVMDHESQATRVELKPETGRSHQLRVHMMSVGHPIIGDPFYGPRVGSGTNHRLQLHAESLRFRHPEGGAWVTYADPTPF